MKEASKFMKISSIIVFASGLFFPTGAIYNAFLFSLAFFILAFSLEEEKMKQYDILIILLSVFLFLTNLFAGITMLIAYIKVLGEKNNSPPVRYKRSMDKDAKKIDILLKLGVGMVFISGILFATTSWNFISSITKTVLLVLLGILFLLLTFLSEKKLKLYKTSYMYWILSMAFFFLSIIGTLYFNILNSNFTFQGDGRYLTYFIIWQTVVGLSYATYLKFPKKYLLYLSYTACLLMISFLLMHFQIDNGVILSIISLIILFSIILSDKKSILYEFSEYILLGLLFLIIKSINSNPLYIWIACFLNIIAHYYLTIQEGKTNKWSLGYIYLLTFIAFGNLNIDNSYAFFLIFLTISLHTILERLNIFKNEKSDTIFNYVLYCISTAICFATCYHDNHMMGLFISIFYLLENMILGRSLSKEKNLKFVIYLEPASILLFIYAFFHQNFFSTTMEFQRILLIASVIYCIIAAMLKEKREKDFYMISISVVTIGCLNWNLVMQDSLTSLMVLFPSSYGLIDILFHYSPEKNKQLGFRYIILLFGIYSILYPINIFQLKEITSSILLIGYFIITIILLKNDTIKKINYIGLVAPLLHLINYYDFHPEYKQIMISILILYITFIIVKFISKDDNNKNMIAIIGIIISILILDMTIYTVGIYIGIVGILVILIGYYKKELKGLFLTGVIITILNIIYQLRELWEKIPFWLYLLIGGLTLIGFVTYKEIKKSNKK